MDRRTTAAPSSRPVRLLTVTVLLLLVAQFLVGMVVNLFVTIPKNHPGARPGEYFSGSLQSVNWALGGSGLPWLETHAGIGVLLFVAAVALLLVAIRSGRRAHVIAAAFGLAGIIAAGFNGASFLDFNEDFSSMLMSGGFALALTAYVLGLYAARSQNVAAR
jgi:hypothetical protein